MEQGGKVPNSVRALLNSIRVAELTAVKQKNEAEQRRIALELQAVADLKHRYVEPVPWRKSKRRSANEAAFRK